MQETQETQVQSLSQKDPLEKGMAIPASILAWEIPWTYDPKAFHPLLRKHTQCTSKINTGPCFPPIRVDSFLPLPGMLSPQSLSMKILPIA